MDFSMGTDSILLIIVVRILSEERRSPPRGCTLSQKDAPLRDMRLIIKTLCNEFTYSIFRHMKKLNNILSTITSSKYDINTTMADTFTTYEYNGTVFSFLPESHAYNGYVFAQKLTDIVDADEEIRQLKLVIENEPDDCAWACANLGNIHRYVVDHINIDEAVRYYELAVSKGLYNTYNSLGYLYAYTDGYIDIPKAIKYYKLAIMHSDTTNTPALINSAHIYATDNVHRNMLKAIKYYGRAIKCNASAVRMFFDTEINTDSVFELTKQYADHYDEHKKLKKLVKEQAKQIEELENYVTELEFQPGGIGCLNAQKEFDELKEQLH